jgi:hypothetical protein
MERVGYLRQAQAGIVAARTARGQVPRQVLLDVLSGFRSAAGLFAQAGDRESQELALAEVARISLIVFVEDHEGGKKATADECTSIANYFPRINVDDPQAARKMNDVAQICYSVTGGL